MTKRVNPALAPLVPLVEDSSQPSYIRELLVTGRDVGAGGYDVDRGLATHLARIDAGAPLPDWAKSLQPSGAGAAAAAGSSIVGWVAAPLVAGVAGLMVAAAVLWTRPEVTPVLVGQQPRTNAVATPVAESSAPMQALAPRTAARAVPPEVALVPELAPVMVHAKHRAVEQASKADAIKTDAAKAVAPTATPVVAAVPAATQKPTPDLFQTAHAAPKPSPAAQAATTLSPAREQAVAATQQAAARPVAPAPAAQDDSLLEREMGMIAMAQRVLQTEPAHALKLARQGEAEFRGSMFTQERQQLLLLALVKLGRIDEAKQLAKPYLARFPHGPFSDRVRLALATGKVER
jgi:hypothetical protein